MECALSQRTDKTPFNIVSELSQLSSDHNMKHFCQKLNLLFQSITRQVSLRAKWAYLTLGPIQLLQISLEVSKNMHIHLLQVILGVILTLLDAAKDL